MMTASSWLLKQSSERCSLSQKPSSRRKPKRCSGWHAGKVCWDSSTSTYTSPPSAWARTVTCGSRERVVAPCHGRSAAKVDRGISVASQSTGEATEESAPRGATQKRPSLPRPWLARGPFHPAYSRPIQGSRGGGGQAELRLAQVQGPGVEPWRCALTVS